MGDFAYSLGLNNLASNMYQKTYEKEKNIYYCYKSLNIEIKNVKMNFEAPINSNEKVGNLVINIGDEKLMEIEILTNMLLLI